MAKTVTVKSGGVTETYTTSPVEGYKANTYQVTGKTIAYTNAKTGKPLKSKQYVFDTPNLYASKIPKDAWDSLDAPIVNYYGESSPELEEMKRADRSRQVSERGRLLGLSDAQARAERDANFRNSSGTGDS